MISRNLAINLAKEKQTNEASSGFGRIRNWRTSYVQEATAISQSWTSKGKSLSFIGQNVCMYTGNQKAMNPEQKTPFCPKAPKSKKPHMVITILLVQGAINETKSMPLIMYKREALLPEDVISTPTSLSRNSLTVMCVSPRLYGNKTFF